MKVESSCTFGAGCDTPGYEVQWPYIQGSKDTECDAFGTYDSCTSTKISTKSNCNASASKCVFPFTYDGLTFKECTTYASTSGKHWCSLSADFDDPVSGGRWGHCNPCRGEEVPLAPELLQGGKCSVVREGETGWMWDPFLAQLRNEYMDCSVATDCVGDVCASKVVPANIPILQEVHVKGQKAYSPMHFSTDYYEKLHTNTLKCMRKTQETLTAAVVKEFFGNSDAQETPNDTLIMVSYSEWLKLDSTQAAAAFQVLRDCIGKKQNGLGSVNRCACDKTNYFKWPIYVFFTERGLPTHRCLGGRDSNSICDPKANTCRDTATCDQTFENQSPIAISSRYGCFFAHPSAKTPIAARYESCGIVAMSKVESQSTTFDEGKLEYEQSVEVFKTGITRRTVLAAVFLLKELNFLTSFLMLIIIVLLLLPIAILLGIPTCVIFFCYWSKTPHRHARCLFFLVMIKDILIHQIWVLLVMCVNFSTTFRIYKLASTVYKLEVNRSIKDMDRKLTSLANTVYNLLIIFSGSSSEGALLVSLIASLVLLLRQMNEEKVMLQQIAGPLKDFNENRLSTFEVALLWIKVLEDILDDNVQFNWVQIFRVREPLKPTLHEPRTPDAEKTCIDEPGRFNDWITEILHRNWQDHHLANQPEKFKEEYAYKEASDARDLLYLEPLKRELRKTFGHDNKGFSHNLHTIPRTVETKTVPRLVSVSGSGSRQYEYEPKIRFIDQADTMLSNWAVGRVLTKLPYPEDVSSSEGYWKKEPTHATVTRERETAIKRLKSSTLYAGPAVDTQDDAEYWAQIAAAASMAAAAAASASAAAASLKVSSPAAVASLAASSAKKKAAAAAKVAAAVEAEGLYTEKEICRLTLFAAGHGVGVKVPPNQREVMTWCLAYLQEVAAKAAAQAVALAEDEKARAAAEESAAKLDAEAAPFFRRDENKGVYSC